MHTTLMFSSAIVVVLLGLVASSESLPDKRIADNDFAQMRSQADRDFEVIAFKNLLREYLGKYGKRNVEKRLSQNDFAEQRSNQIDEEIMKQMIAQFLNRAGRR